MRTGATCFARRRLAPFGPPALRRDLRPPRRARRRDRRRRASRRSQTRRKNSWPNLAGATSPTALLYAHPDIATRPLRGEFERFPWRDDEEGFRAWARGRTGYPIVDAGMRQLWRTGYLPNRVRMIVASFLVKHLLIDWRRGEEWFWDTLIDADPASNPMSWQWVAGSGADAAPYFRIFNPVLQAEKFDPDGAYVRRWVPELARLEAPAIHAPGRLRAKRWRERASRWARPIRSRSSTTPSPAPGRSPPSHPCARAQAARARAASSPARTLPCREAWSRRRWRRERAPRRRAARSPTGS